MRGTSVGVALGGGGVRGLGHISALEVIDGCGITPKVVAGTSMGALIGALYASGKSGKAVRELIQQHMVMDGEHITNIYAKKHFLLKWLHAIRFSKKGSGVFRVDGFLQQLLAQTEASCFEDLEIPLLVVATDFASGEAVVFDSGPLLPALKASIAVPGVFEPVQFDDRILFDGGVSNNLPYDLIADACDVTIAVDVGPTRTRETSGVPSMIDATVGMFDVLMARATKAKLEKSPPDIYFHPRIEGVRMLEFHKAEEVLRQTSGGLDGFRQKVEAIG